jgi:DNA-binding NarL/FixJ family response regulator
VSEAPLRILVCDDSFGFPSVVEKQLDDDDRFEPVGTARSGAELLTLVERVEADAIMLDLVLPDVDNPAALVGELRRRRPGVRILLVSSLRVPELERAANGAGVDGFCHKATSPQGLSDALYQVATA